MEKSCDEFYRSSSSRDGLQAYCKPCKRESVKESRRRHTGALDCDCTSCAARANAANGLRRCPKCDQLVQFDDFTKSRSTKSGFGGYCKSCAAGVEAVYRQAAIEASVHEQDCECRICVIRSAAQGTLKRCPNCEVSKERGEFSKSEGALDGLQGWCKECLSDLQEREGRWWYRRRTYNLDRDQFWELLNSQGGLCGAGCGGLLDESEATVDHDHACCDRDGSCGRCIRGLLCRNCNTALGMIKDNPNTAMALATYLMSFEDVLRPSA